MALDPANIGAAMNALQTMAPQRAGGESGGGHPLRHVMQPHQFGGDAETGAGESAGTGIAEDVAAAAL